MGRICTTILTFKEEEDREFNLESSIVPWKSIYSREKRSRQLTCEILKSQDEKDYNGSELLT